MPLLGPEIDVTLNPAANSRSLAAAPVRPAVGGTGRGSGPFDTDSVTNASTSSCAYGRIDEITMSLGTVS